MLTIEGAARIQIPVRFAYIEHVKTVSAGVTTTTKAGRSPFDCEASRLSSAGRHTLKPTNRASIPVTDTTHIEKKPGKTMVSTTAA
jgi:hypothetical protein